MSLTTEQAQGMRSRPRMSEILELKRARAVQLTEIPMVRQPARLSGYSSKVFSYRWLWQEHIDSCYVTNPETNQREFVESLVDART
jgi:hypothetical protein